MARSRALGGTRVLFDSRARVGRSGRRVEETHQRNARSPRQLLRHRLRLLGARPVGEAALHLPVLERVVRQHEHPAFGREQVDRLVEPGREVRQLVVHLDADRLERAARGMAAAPAGGRRDPGLDRLDQVAGVAQRAGGDDPRRDPARVPLLAVAGDERGELGLGVLVDDVGGGQRLRAVHPHVEWGFVCPIREPAHARIELRAADPQVEQDSHDFLASVAPHDVGDSLEAALHDAGPFPEGSERRARRRDSGRIPVDAEETEVGSGSQDRSRVPASTDGSVDDQPGGNGAEQVHHLRLHDRSVLELLRHVCSRTLAFPGPPPAPRMHRRKRSGRKGRSRQITRRAGGGPERAHLSRGWVRYRTPASRRSRSVPAHPLGRVRATGPDPRSRSGRTHPRRPPRG